MSPLSLPLARARAINDLPGIPKRANTTKLATRAAAPSKVCTWQPRCSQTAQQTQNAAVDVVSVCARLVLTHAALPPSTNTPLLLLQRPLLLAALAVCAGAIALSAAFPRPTSRLEEEEQDGADDVAAALEREARGVTTGVLWGTRDEEPSSNNNNKRG